MMLFRFGLPKVADAVEILISSVYASFVDASLISSAIHNGWKGRESLEQILSTKGIGIGPKESGLKRFAFVSSKVLRVSPERYFLKIGW
jgi:hypothetical protein